MIFKNKLLIFSLFFIFSCEKEPIKYSLNINIIPVEGGLVNPRTGLYEAGETVNILASPNQFYSFKNWTGSYLGNLQSATIKMDSDKTITANFILKDYQIIMYLVLLFINFHYFFLLLSVYQYFFYKYHPFYKTDFSSCKEHKSIRTTRDHCNENRTKHGSCATTGILHFAINIFIMSALIV